MRICGLVLSVVVGGVCVAQSAVGTKAPNGAAGVVELWAAGAVPGAVGTTFDDVPKMWTYPARGKGPHAAVVIFPGGGYTHLAIAGEGEIEAKWLNEHGVSAYVVQYRLAPRYRYPWAMVDAERAVRMVRAHAKEWGVKPDAIGVWGFSAGGHLVGYLATAAPHGDPALEIAPEPVKAWAHDAVDAESAHPDFAIVNYGRLSLDAEIPGTKGMETLTGKDASEALVHALSPIEHVTKETSPCFLYATERDEKVNSINATRFFEALQRAGVPAEVHVFEQGMHGTHMGTDKPQWPELAVYPVLLQHWMEVHGWME